MYHRASDRKSIRTRQLRCEPLEVRQLLAITYPIVDTGQTTFYDDTSSIAAPVEGDAYYGQDAQYDDNQPSYTLSADGLTVYDDVTELTWTQSPDLDGDGDIDANDKVTFEEAQAYVGTLNTEAYGGYTDWRLPSIKELYSLIDFSGSDPSGYNGTDTSGLTPFIDTDYFDFDYGDTDADERIIDAQFASSTLYVGNTANDGGATLFGVNFADGRIKGYGLQVRGNDKTFYAYYVCGNTDYGDNHFVDNLNDTITDNATGLMWSQDDSGAGMDWEDALAWVQQKNDENYLGYSDWRLPNVNELQSIVDYTRSPSTTASPAIDPVFNTTAITIEDGSTDYPFFWSSTTHANWRGFGDNAAYVSFGEALGYMQNNWIDVHGAGAQRSDPKAGDPADWPTGHGPQGDAIRIYNYVRLVRDVEVTGDENIAPTADAGGPYTAEPSEVIAIDGLTSFDVDGTIATYEWDLDNDGQYDDAIGATTSFMSPTAGTYTVGLRVTDNEGEQDTSTATITVAESGESFDGYNLFSSLNSTTVYLMDNDGNFVHSWDTNYTPGNSMYLLEDGELLHTGSVHNSTFNAGGAGGVVQTIDWDGNVTWEYGYSSTTYLQHHDVEMLPNGNVLMIAWQYKSESEAIAAGRDTSLLADGELWPDSVIEVQPTGLNTGTIVWEWHAWDHLVQDYSSSQDNYGVVADHPELIDLNYATSPGADWTHINSIDYNAELDQIVLSVHNFSEIWIIDHSTTSAEAASHSGGESGMGGDLLYRWGNPQTYDAGTATDQQLFVQHDAEWVEEGLPGEGNILIFNNGGGRPGGNYSSIEEIVTPLNPDGSYQLTTGSDYGPEEPAWTYTTDTATDFYSQNISGSQRLPNGNTLICDGPNSYFFEVTDSGEIVWEYDYVGAVFRVERYAPEYAGFDGTPLDDEPAVPIPGDANGDGKVDGSDATILATNWQVGVSDGQTATFEMGDFNDDGKVDGSDATILAANWQTGVSTTVVATSAPDTEVRPTQFVPPANTSSRIATVPVRTSLPPRRPITPMPRLGRQTPESVDMVFAETRWDEDDLTLAFKDFTPISPRQTIATRDKFFALKLDSYIY